MASAKMVFRNAANVSSSLQLMMRLCLISSPGGFANRLEIANLVRVEPSVTSNPNFDSKSNKTSFETL